MARSCCGGYQFRGNARRITLLDVIQLFESLGPDGVRLAAAGSTAEARVLIKVVAEVDECSGGADHMNCYWADAKPK